MIKKNNNKIKNQSQKDINIMLPLQLGFQVDYN